MFHKVNIPNLFRGFGYATTTLLFSGAVFFSSRIDTNKNVFPRVLNNSLLKESGKSKNMISSPIEKSLNSNLWRFNVINAEEKEIKNILLFGRTGNGKSTLANVLVNKGNNFEEVFKESEHATSETRDIATWEFEEKGIKYKVIDTVGIGDTKLSYEEVLRRIVGIAPELRNGLCQIFFVTSGRFTEEEIKTYDLMNRVIFDQGAAKYITIIRTNFPNFRDPKKCENDIEKMIEENPQIAELIKNCRKIIHVNNPSLNIVDNEKKWFFGSDRMSLNKKDRKESRNKLLDHLTSCKEIYEPKVLNTLSERIEKHLIKSQEIKKRLESKDLSNEERKKLEREWDILINIVLVVASFIVCPILGGIPSSLAGFGCKWPW